MTEHDGLHGATWSRRAVLLTGLLLVAGCGKPARPAIVDDGAGVTSDPAAQALRAILDRRAKALQQNDDRAFLADLDASNQALVEHEKMVFNNLRQFKFSNFGYVTERINSGTHENGAYQFRSVIEIAQLTADEGAGGVAPSETFNYSLAKKDNRFVVTEIVASTVDNAEKLHITGSLADAPWNTTPLKVMQVGKVWLAADASVTDLDRYAAAAQTEAQRIEALWGQRTAFPGQVLFFTRNTDNFRAWYGFGAASNFNPDMEGVEVPLQGVRKTGERYNGQYAGSRIVVNLKSISTWGDSPQGVMRHELAHAITARKTMVSLNLGGELGAPTWAMEGFARWTETIDNPQRMAAVRSDVANGVAAGKFHGKVPKSKDFYGNDISFNYDLSATVFAFIERIKGREAAVEFYASIIEYSDNLDTAVADAPIFTGICKRVLGVDGPTFTGQWASFVRGGA